MSWSDAGGRCDLKTALEDIELSNSAVEADVALATLGTTQRAEGHPIPPGGTSATYVEVAA